MSSWSVVIDDDDDVVGPQVGPLRQPLSPFDEVRQIFLDPPTPEVVPDGLGRLTRLPRDDFGFSDDVWRWLTCVSDASVNTCRVR